MLEGLADPGEDDCPCIFVLIQGSGFRTCVTPQGCVPLGAKPPRAAWAPGRPKVLTWTVGALCAQHSTVMLTTWRLLLHAGVTHAVP